MPMSICSILHQEDTHGGILKVKEYFVPLPWGYIGVEKLDRIWLKVTNIAFKFISHLCHKLTRWSETNYSPVTSAFTLLFQLCLITLHSFPPCSLFSLLLLPWCQVPWHFVLDVSSPRLFLLSETCLLSLPWTIKVLPSLGPSRLNPWQRDHFHFSQRSWTANVLTSFIPWGDGTFRNVPCHHIDSEHK